jgi:hypothetical protein
LAVLCFRKAITLIEKRYPFSHAFGTAYSREARIELAQDVYQRLLMRSGGEEVLLFETIALLALEENSNIDQAKAKALVKLFRPDQQGHLSILDFVKSVDAVYKEVCLLGATIHNSSQIDRAFENIFDVVFYMVVMTIIDFSARLVSLFSINNDVSARTGNINGIFLTVALNSLNIPQQSVGSLFIVEQRDSRFCLYD